MGKKNPVILRPIKRDFNKKFFKDMINRRLLRTKVVQVLYGYYKTGDSTIATAEKELLHSIQKTYDLYHLFLLLVLDVQEFAFKKLDQARNRHIQRMDDLSPVIRLSENKFGKQLAENEDLKSYLAKNKLSWVNYPELIKELYTTIQYSEFMDAYMKLDEPTYEEDKKLWVRIFNKIIAHYEPFAAILEEQSIFWNDDAEFVLSMVVKTIKKFDKAQGPFQRLMPLYKDREDEDFVVRLFRKSILNGEDYRSTLSKYTENWDLERLAFMDVLLLQVGLAEIMEFPHIPVKVSLNEYIELAK